MRFQAGEETGHLVDGVLPELGHGCVGRLAAGGDGGLEAAARKARYAALARHLDDGDWLLSAHHRNDQGETLLLNLMRGSGPAGLAGIGLLSRIGSGWLVRPLVDVPRAALEAYADSSLDPGLTPHDIGWLGEISDLPIIVKGVLRDDDAAVAVEIGELDASSHEECNPIAWSNPQTDEAGGELAHGRDEVRGAHVDEPVVVDVRTGGARRIRQNQQRSRSERHDTAPPTRTRRRS